MKLRALRFPLVFIGVPLALSFAFGTSLVPVLAAFAAYVLLVFGSGSIDPGKPRSRFAKLGPLLFLALLFFGVPMALASLVAASWPDIAIAYAIWFGLLGLWTLQMLQVKGISKGEAAGWPIIIGMFLTMGAVPIITLALRLVRWAF